MNRDIVAMSRKTLKSIKDASFAEGVEAVAKYFESGGSWARAQLAQEIREEFTASEERSNG